VAQRLAVGIDVGGTKLAAGLVASDGTVLARARLETPVGEGDAIVSLIGRVVADLSAGQVAGSVPVGVGAAGIVDRKGVVRYAPNIGWRDFPLRQQVAALIGGPVVVENDANVAAWGEYRAGAGIGAGESMVMLTVGTGVGGGLVLADRLVRGGHGLAAEFGHIIVCEGGPRCPCGNRGCLEPLASGTAIGRLARDAFDQGRIPPDSALAGVARENLTGKAVTAAAERGEDLARDILSACGTWLGVGIASLVHALDPEVIVVGGGAMQAGDLLLDPARRAFAERLMGRTHRPMPDIVPARLGDDAGLVGAALLALDAAAS
jgi:glucokinase